MKDKILSIITEGGREFGFGHITRCLSIAAAFQKHGYEIKFIINGDDSVSSLLKYEYDIFEWTKDKNKLLEKIKNSSLILIDSIKIQDEQISEIENTDISVVFIDDEKRRNILSKGFVVDWTVLSDKKDYFIPKKESVTYLLGSIYTPLRDEFSTAEQNKIKHNLSSLMVTFGGADVRNLTPSILKLLSVNFPDMKKNIVIGAGFTNTKEIEKYRDKNTNLIFNADTKRMIELMQSSDIAIASGGQTLYELARIGTPAIAVLLVENAKDDTEGWAKVGSLEYIGSYENKELLERLISKIVFLQDYAIRKEMQNRAKEHINPKGAELLAESILEKLG